MNSIKNTQEINTDHYTDAFNAGYDVGKILYDDPKVAKALDQFIDRNNHIPELIGVKDGFQEALFERKQQLHKDRLDKLKSLRSNQRDFDLER